ANATFIHSDVTLPPDEARQFNSPAIKAPMSSRDMTNAPDHLYNLYTTYDIAASGTQFALFYTEQGDTLISGATVSNGFFVPSIYATKVGTLNFSVSQKVGAHMVVQFQARNITNPQIQEVYRSTFIGSDVTKTSYRRGTEYTIALSFSF